MSVPGNRIIEITVSLTLNFIMEGTGTSVNKAVAVEENWLPSPWKARTEITVFKDIVQDISVDFKVFRETENHT